MYPGFIPNLSRFRQVPQGNERGPRRRRGPFLCAAGRRDPIKSAAAPRAFVAYAATVKRATSEFRCSAVPESVWAEAAISWAEALVCCVEAETCSAEALDSSATAATSTTSFSARDACALIWSTAG